MIIALIVQPGHPDSGIGRYATELERILCALGHQVIIVHPLVPIPMSLLRLIKNWPGWDLVSFLNHFPLFSRYPSADIYHLTSQNLATLLVFNPPPGKTVVTVHDLIPWLTRHDKELRVYSHPIEKIFDRISIQGIKRADNIIFDSEFSKSSSLHPIGWID